LERARALTGGSAPPAAGTGPALELAVAFSEKNRVPVALAILLLAILSVGGAVMFLQHKQSHAATWRGPTASAVHRVVTPAAGDAGAASASSH